MPNDRSAAAAGRVAIERNACGSCHRIPGIALADGRVGPSLDGFASRQMIAGRFPNSLANLTAYLRNPHIAGEGGVMPDMGLGERQARDVAAYLARLR